jgi:phosphate/sulfate permease
MSISPIIKAPLVVQLYRCFFTACIIYFGSFLWRFRHGGSLVGLLFIASFPFCGLLGLIATCIRVPSSRWVLSVVGILIPGVVSLGLFFILHHDEWWEWLLSPLFFFVWLAMPVSGAIALFRDKRTSEYFTKQRPNNSLQATAAAPASSD